MDRQTFENLAQLSQQAHGSAAAWAEYLVLPVFAVAIIGGFLFARWIFRGGLSRLRYE